MIDELEIENFRSIKRDKISLSPLTVLIGANGAGKSNLVKALEFIADIPRSGLALALSRQGGRQAILPKAMKAKDMLNAKTSFFYRTRMPPPLRNNVAKVPDFFVEHDFTLSYKDPLRVILEKEKLTFHEVLAIGKLIGRQIESDKDADLREIFSGPNSRFTLSQDNSDGFNYKMDPPVSPENVTDYVRWLGFELLEEKITNEDELDSILQSFRSDFPSRTANKKYDDQSRLKSFLNPDLRTILDFSHEFNVFRASEMSIRRYDLLLNELRQEQSPGQARELTKSGSNLPSVLRNLMKESEESDSWERLKSTFESIAPHIVSMHSSQLRTGKEFVEFGESRNGRKVESWESSDGSLRALAILLAVEAATPGDTLIIEEPEQNLHPWAVRTLIDHIRDVISDQHIQVIITTHSEQVLERVEPDEVRVVSRDQEMGTRFHKLSQILSGGKIEMGEVGRLWVKGLLQGIPKALS